jgi:alpha-1,2-mannosyltransferase
MGWFPTKQTAVRIVVGVVLVFAVATAASQFRRPGLATVYLKGADRFTSGEQMYVIEPQAHSYPPFFVLPFALLVPFTDPVRHVLWWAANIGILIAVIGLVAAMIRPSLPADRRERVVYGVVVGVLSARFLLSPLEYQSHDLIVLLMVLVSAHFAARGGQIAAGAAAGIATACKATPLLLLPYFLWRRAWLAAVATVCVAVAATLLPDVISPNPAGQLWVRSWYDSFVSKVSAGEAADAAGAWVAWNELNQSLPGTIYRWFTSPPSADQINVSLVALSPETIRGIALAAQAIALLLIAWSTRRVRPEVALQVPVGECVLAHYGMILCGMLLLSPMSSSAHFCGLLVPIAVLVREASRRPRDRAAVAGLGVVFFLGTLSAQDLIGRFVADRVQVFGGATLCTAACLVSLAWVARNWTATPEPPPLPTGQTVASET